MGAKRITSLRDAQLTFCVETEPFEHCKQCNVRIPTKQLKDGMCIDCELEDKTKKKVITQSARMIDCEDPPFTQHEISIYQRYNPTFSLEQLSALEAQFIQESERVNVPLKTSPQQGYLGNRQIPVLGIYRHMPIMFLFNDYTQSVVETKLDIYHFCDVGIDYTVFVVVWVANHHDKFYKNPEINWFF